VPGSTPDVSELRAAPRAQRTLNLRPAIEPTREGLPGSNGTAKRLIRSVTMSPTDAGGGGEVVLIFWGGVESSVTAVSIPGMCAVLILWDVR
jgi:hypothetical protein